MECDGNRLIVVDATAGAQRLLGATAMCRNGWGTTAIGPNSDRLIVVGATAGARGILGATAMGRAGWGTTAWWVDGSWARRQCATTAGAG